MTEQEILDHLLAREGGYVNRRNDRGGPTNRGITLPALSEYLGREATIEELRALDEATTRDLYRELYIVRPGFRALGTGASFELLIDCGVHHGRNRAVRWLQQALGGVDVDGRIGPETRRAIVTRGSDRLIYRRVLATRARVMGEILRDDPTQREFAAGWLARLASFVERTP